MHPLLPSSGAFAAYRTARAAYSTLLARSRTPLPDDAESRLHVVRRLRILVGDTLALVRIAWEQGVALEESLLRHIDRTVPESCGNAAEARSRADLLALHRDIRLELDALGADSRLGPRHAENLETIARVLRTLHALLVAQKTRLLTLGRRSAPPPLTTDSHRAKTEPCHASQPWQRRHPARSRSHPKHALLRLAA